MQEKKILNLEQNIVAERAEFNNKLKEKDLQLKKLDEEMNAIKSSLRGCNKFFLIYLIVMGEVTPASRHFPKSIQNSKITEPRFSTRNTFSNK